MDGVECRCGFRDADDDEYEDDNVNVTHTNDCNKNNIDFAFDPLKLYSENVRKAK